MVTMTYTEQLRHPYWQRKRLEVLEAAGFECESCGDTEKTLHVHHKKYVKGRKAWEYEREELAALCEDCHEKEHKARDLLDRMVAEVGNGGLEIILALSAGYLLASMDLTKELSDEIQRLYGGLYFEVGLVATTLDHGHMGWRDVLIEHVAKHPANPVTAYYAAEWQSEKSKG